MGKVCGFEGCGRGCYGEFCLMHKPRKGLPKVRGKIIKPGKAHVNWVETKIAWYKENKPDHAGYYYCHYCGKAMQKDDSTLDHKLIRGHYPQFRYDQDNLLICCWEDNSRRGSMEYERYIKKYYPGGVYANNAV